MATTRSTAELTKHINAANKTCEENGVRHELVSIREVDNDIWQVSFLEYDLGHFDKERDRVEPGPSPLMPDKVLTTCPEQGVDHVTG